MMQALFEAEPAPPPAGVDRSEIADIRALATEIGRTVTDRTPPAVLLNHSMRLIGLAQGGFMAELQQERTRVGMGNTGELMALQDEFFETMGWFVDRIDAGETAGADFAQFVRQWSERYLAEVGTVESGADQPPTSQ